MLKVIIVMLVALGLTGCKKSISSTPENNKGDVVVGTFLEFSFTTGSPVISASATVSKISTGAYKFTASNSIPPFNFNLDGLTTTLVGAFNGHVYYTIPVQITNGTSIDTIAGMDYDNAGTRNLHFNLTSKSSNKTWQFNGVKQ